MTAAAEQEPTVYRCRLIGLRGEDRGPFQQLALHTWVQDDFGTVYVRQLAATEKGEWNYLEITLKQVTRS